mgnify:CR=1 FL=1
MRSPSLEFGKAAEAAAVEFLKSKGYKILELNYKNQFGEIDVIARDKGVICFVEVKARHSLRQGAPQEAVTPAKQRQISRAAVSYLKSKGLLDRPARFDVLGILYEHNQQKVSLIADAFELASGLTD